MLGTTDEYFAAIAHHFEQSSAETLYPGEIYFTLKEFLQQKPNTTPNVDNHESSDFAWLISPSQLGQQASSDKHSPDRYKNRGSSQGFTDLALCIEVLKSNIEQSHPQVLFLRGHPSPNWLLTIGAFCYVDPELFRWFLRYRAEPRSDYYFDSAPSLMSSIFCFKFFTIGSNNYRYPSSQEQVDSLRAKAATDLLSYQTELRRSGALQLGDSIVRNFHVLDEQHCVIEQEIVISVFDVGKTWMGMNSGLAETIGLLITTAIACTDAGCDLTKGPRFPWLGGGAEPSPVKLLPIFQYIPRCALKSPSIKDTATGPKKGRNTQSLAVFPEGYGRGLDWSQAKSDRFHALWEVFRLAAFSQKQLLNVLKEKITTETNRLLLKNENPTLANLLYFRDILQDQLSNSSYMIQIISDRNKTFQHGRRPIITTSNDQRSAADQAVAQVSGLFQDLHSRAQSLHEKCTQGMTVISNNSMLAESQRAIQQAKLVTKLTLVAFVYLPFTFTAGFFGMNFTELGTGTIHLWIFFATSLPLMFVTMAFFALDAQTIKRILRILHIASGDQT